MMADAPLPAWVFLFKKDNFIKLSKSLAAFTDVLVDRNIAHNLAMIRDGGKNGIRVFLWARQSTTGARSYNDFHVAVTELIGHCYYGVYEQFETHTEDDIETVFRKYRLLDSQYSE